MNRPYAVVFENVAVSAGQDFFELSAADDKPLFIVGLSIDNVGGTADAGDAQEENLRVTIKRGHTTSGSGGSAPTPTPLSSNDTAAGFAAEVNNTTIASAGTAVTLWAGGFNVRTGLREYWPEPLWMGAPQGSLIVVRLEAAPADSIALSGTLYVVEPY